ncbi:unnamed protein product [Polarella glacialis]|uniref:Glutathione gamma-glutamylcysteinyltransferase n=1 Tax=Polarella glacialis TaxID=89957 RepID=A0A813IJU0_POLGL|nr:unnamed protein product [Polarella glacialis]CAE8651193.1 unnamed protein product [Polarella glacialis]
MVFWVCVLALNQHRAAEEVGSSPEDGPFNAALMQAKAGAVMILDNNVHPFRRIWCLYEVKRLTDLNKDFQLICSLGPVGSLLEASTGRAPAKQRNQHGNNNKQAVVYNSSFHSE